MYVISKEHKSGRATTPASFFPGRNFKSAAHFVPLLLKIHCCQVRLKFTYPGSIEIIDVTLHKNTLYTHAPAKGREEGELCFCTSQIKAALFLFLLPRHESLIPAYPATDAIKKKSIEEP